LDTSRVLGAFWRWHLNEKLELDEALVFVLGL
jgi:hypothetical protein